MTIVRSQQPRRGTTRVASRFNGWYKEPDGNACRRYATSTTDSPCLVPKGTTAMDETSIPAVETASYHCQMPNGIGLVEYTKLELKD